MKAPAGFFERLRVELYTGAQQLEAEERDAFKALIFEIVAILNMQTRRATSPGDVYYYDGKGEPVTCGKAQISGADGVLAVRLEHVPMQSCGLLYIDPATFSNARKQ